MNIDQYNAARLAIEPAYRLMMSEPINGNIADFYMACAINGLVVVKADEMPKVPAPICGFLEVPDKYSPWPGSAHCFIFPADQHLP